MKQPTLIILSIFILTSFALQPTYINPTGTYRLDSKTTKKKGEIYGYFGQIQVKQIDSDKIVMTFAVNKGAPS